MVAELGWMYTCDSCGSTLFVPQQRYHAKGFHSFKNEFYTSGWVRDTGKQAHFCPECVRKTMAGGVR